MRWYKPPYTEQGQTRAITRFLWFPVTIGLETRWLEKACYLQKFQKRISKFHPSKWVNYKWINK